MKYENLWCRGSDSPGRQRSTQSGAAVGQDVSVAVWVVVVLPSLGGPGPFDLDQDRNRERTVG